MKFLPIDARPDWKQKAEKLGYLAAVLDDPPYWSEALKEPFCAEFTQAEIRDLLIPASMDLNQLALEAVEYVCFGKESDTILDKMKVPQPFREPIRQSWKRRDRSLYGRFDFSYSGGELKLLELNFDTAISLYEAAVFQLIWLNDLTHAGKLPPDCEQFNFVHSHLLDAFLALAHANHNIHFTSLEGTPEDEDTTKYLQSCAVLAGMKSKFLHLHQLGFDEKSRLLDLEGEEITQLFKLYPWEYFFADDQKIEKETGKSLLQPILSSGSTSFFEPVWKTILANKGILPVLWELAPECRWLLEAHFEDSPKALELKKRPHARKPIYGREGGNIALVYPDEPTRSFISPGIYGKEGYVLQALHPLPKHGDYHVLLGCWTICGQASGLGIRADRSPVTTGMHCIFVPHYVEAVSSSA